MARILFIPVSDLHMENKDNYTNVGILIWNQYLLLKYLEYLIKPV